MEVLFYWKTYNKYLSVTINKGDLPAKGDRVDVFDVKPLLKVTERIFYPEKNLNQVMIILE